jgi:hypothetical protein
MVRNYGYDGMMKNKRCLTNILILFFSILLTFIVLEIIFRIFNFEVLIVNNPYKYTKTIGKYKLATPFHTFKHVYPLLFDKRGYYSKSNGVVEYNHNQFGARWISSTKQELSGKRILVLGDSFTFGFGLRYEDTFVYMLHSKLINTELEYNFFNFAKPAANSIVNLKVLKKNYPLIKPHMVIYFLNVNDLIQFPTSYIITQHRKWKHPIIEFSKFIKFIFLRIYKKLQRTRNIERLSDPSALEKEYYLKNMQALHVMNQEAIARGSKFFVVLLPILVDLKIDTFKPVYKRILKDIKMKGVEVLDLSSVLSDFEEGSLWILPFDQHPNELASEVFADHTESFLRKF